MKETTGNFRGLCARFNRILTGRTAIAIAGLAIGSHCSLQLNNAETIIADPAAGVFVWQSGKKKAVCGPDRDVVFANGQKVEFIAQGLTVETIVTESSSAISRHKETQIGTGYKGRSFLTRHTWITNRKDMVQSFAQMDDISYKDGDQLYVAYTVAQLNSLNRNLRDISFSILHADGESSALSQWPLLDRLNMITGLQGAPHNPCDGSAGIRARARQVMQLAG